MTDQPAVAEAQDVLSVGPSPEEVVTPTNPNRVPPEPNTKIFLGKTVPPQDGAGGDFVKPSAPPLKAAGQRVNGYITLPVHPPGQWRIHQWLSAGMQYLYSAVPFMWWIFYKYSQRHPMARPLGRGMGCVCIFKLICILPQLLQWYMQYHVILGHVIAAPDYFVSSGDTAVLHSVIDNHMLGGRELNKGSTHWGANKMADIFRYIFWKKIFVFRSKIHWNLFPKVK